MKQVDIHLIGNPERGDALEELRNLAWDDGIVMCTRHTWVWPIYCRLKMLGRSVTFSYEPREGAINIIHGQVARKLLKPSDFKKYFIIGIRADFRPFPYGHFEIVQNERTAGGRSIFMPLYPQPGLKPRDTGRSGVETICFSGRMQNSIGEDIMQRELEALGCRFVFKGVGEWQDMHDVDVLLGIRSLSTRAYPDKPATKLFNAWLAGIPFIGGYDSAYSQVGIPGKNYLRVSSEQELVEAVRRLKEEPEFYASIVEEGRKAVQAYTAEATTERWYRFLDGPASEAFLQWRSGAGGCRMRASLRGLFFGVYEKMIKANAHRLIAPLRG